MEKTVFLARSYFVKYFNTIVWHVENLANECNFLMQLYIQCTV